jgi:hypothetical protein
MKILLDTDTMEAKPLDSTVLPHVASLLGAVERRDKLGAIIALRALTGSTVPLAEMKQFIEVHVPAFALKIVSVHISAPGAIGRSDAASFLDSVLNRPFACPNLEKYGSVNVFLNEKELALLQGEAAWRQTFTVRRGTALN